MGNNEMSEKRGKWGEISRKQRANYEWIEWHEWGRETVILPQMDANGRKWGRKRAERGRKAVIPSVSRDLGISRGGGLRTGPRCLDCARHDRIGNYGKPSGPIRVWSWPGSCPRYDVRGWRSERIHLRLFASICGCFWYWGPKKRLATGLGGLNGPATSAHLG